MDLESKVRLLSGKDAWVLPNGVVMSDGPIGVRGTRWDGGDPSIALPSPTALAATWDVELTRRVGRLLGQEARRKGAHVLLAPTVNLHRSPLGGRHFEAYSEDPLLTGAIGTAYVKGVQDQGVAATVKHFVANDFETDRFTVDVRVSEKVLRELYLAPFEMIVREGGAWAVMSAYNQVNGVTMTANTWLQRDILKGEWGFDGVIISDWFAARDTVATLLGGLDIAMPAAGSPWGDELVAAVRRGDVPEELVDEAVRRVQLLTERVSCPPDLPPIDGRALAREVAARSFVLLSNRDKLLPLRGSRKVALIGALAKDARVLGGGSAMVFPEHVVSPLEGLRARLEVTYAVGADPRAKLPPAQSPLWTDLKATFIGTSYTVPLRSGFGKWIEPPVDPDLVTAVEISGTLTAETSGTHQLAIRGVGSFTLSANGSVLFDGDIEPDSGDFAQAFLAPPERRFPLPLHAGDSVEVSLRQQGGAAMVSLTLGYGEPAGTPDELLDEAVRVAAGADVAIVVVGTTEEVESEGFDRTTLALPGRQDELVKRVVEANPRTVVVVNAGSPVEMPWADDVAAVLLTWFPGQEAGHALADVLLGDAEPGGRLPTTWPVRASDCPVLSTTPVDGVLSYDEGTFIGYRAWQRSSVKPRFAFGSGQGYTTWEYSTLHTKDGHATVTVRNTGDRPGREVVQVYAGLATPDPALPERWLAGFAVVHADPGETVTVDVPLSERAFQVWEDGAWRTLEGPFVFSLGVRAVPSGAARPDEFGKSVPSNRDRT
jgi:beta-glucosidase